MWFLEAGKTEHCWASRVTSALMFDEKRTVTQELWTQQEREVDFMAWKRKDAREVDAALHEE